MRDIAEYIYGDEYAEKNKAFESEMERIEEKHLDFFKNREPRNETEKHDRLHNHYALSTASGQVSFRFNEGSDLPEEIKQECVEAFHRIWKFD
ncbi:MAG: hypothetical protein M3Q05_03865 [Bacteroidota bacterium]|nr:hypothetical protein [Bacteroidota bacterium]